MSQDQEDTKQDKPSREQEKPDLVSQQAPKHNPPHAPPPPKPDAPYHRRRRRIGWVVFLVLVVLAILILRRCSSGNQAKKAPKAPAGAAITTGQSTTGDINIYVTALGTVTPVYTVTVYSQITGIIMAVHYRQGQLVNKGDPLIDVDPRPYEATLTQAEGTLAHDRGMLDEAVMDLKRYQAADAKNAIAKQLLEDQEKVVIQDQGTVKADEGTVAYDKTQLSYCHIVSPITGRVGLRLVDPGNTIFAGSGSTLVVVTQLEPITVVFEVSEDDLPQIRTQLRGGHRLQVAAFDRANEKQLAAGTLTSLDNEIDTTTGTVKFRADFPNSNLALFPNQFVNARLLVDTLRKVTLVPSAAIQYNGTNSFVYVIKPDNTAAVQPVTVTTGNDKITAVTGINPGVTVATSGFDRLENGAPVLVRNPPAGQPGSHSGSSPNSPQSGAGAPTP